MRNIVLIFVVVLVTGYVLSDAIVAAAEHLVH